MTWSDPNRKLLVILSAINEELTSELSFVKEDKIVNILDVFSHLEPFDVIPRFDSSSALVPIEEPRDYRLSLPDNIFGMGSGALIDALAERGIGILSFDSSAFSSGPHIFVDLFVVNTGFWYFDYPRHVGGSGNRARIFSRIHEGVKIRIRIKEFELDVLKEILSLLETKKKFLFMDESLNLLYTLSWASSERQKMVDLTIRTLELADEFGYIPLGIFYTNSSDITKTLISLRKLPSDYEIKDRILMNKFLSVLGRSPIFGVYSKAFAENEISIDAIYVKPSEGNILRIEFPSKYRGYIEDIHFVVLAQAVLGGGYPYALQKAHEMAVITSMEREIILMEICRRLGIPEPRYIYSKKQYYKWWPVE